MADHDPLPPADDAHAELQRRLAEAEETLRAIRDGEVDALVVRGAEDDQIFALGGQDSYRAFMEAMDIGAAAIDDDGRLIYANAALCKLLRRGARMLQIEGIWPSLGEGAARVVRQLIADAAHGRRSRHFTLSSSHGLRHVEATAAPMPLGFGQGRALTFTDVTDRIEAAAAHESDRIGRAIMASSNEAVVVCNRHGVITHANAAVRHFREGAVTGRMFEEAFPLSFPLASGLIGGADLIDVALAAKAVQGVEATLMVEGRMLDLHLSAGPLRQSGDAIGGAIVTLADVSARKATEKRQAMLVGELTHRMKNLLTLVMSIANRTLAATGDLATFRTAFGRRLEALAATQDLLAKGTWQSLTLEDLVLAELAPYVTLGSDKVALAGLDVRIAADLAVTLGLIFHELVTNAVKYGALSLPEGQVAITGRRIDDALEIVWSESGGPVVVTPERRGFGQTVITRGLGQSGARQTQVEFRPEGLVCRMFLPAGQLDPD